MMATLSNVEPERSSGALQGPPIFSHVPLTQAATAVHIIGQMVADLQLSLTSLSADRSSDESRTGWELKQQLSQLSIGDTKMQSVSAEQL